VWTSLRDVYGRQFTDAHGEEPSAPWIMALADVSDEQCVAACNALLKRTSTFPPNLPEFLDLCRGRDPGVRYLGTPTTPNHAAALDVKAASTEVADRWLAKIRETLRNAPKR
jgi:hypothetical protein